MKGCRHLATTRSVITDLLYLGVSICVEYRTVDRCEIVVLEKRQVTDLKRRIWELRADLIATKDVPLEETIHKQTKLNELFEEDEYLMKQPESKPYSVP